MQHMQDTVMQDAADWSPATGGVTQQPAADGQESQQQEQKQQWQQLTQEELQLVQEGMQLAARLQPVSASNSVQQAVAVINAAASQQLVQVQQGVTQPADGSSAHSTPSQAPGGTGSLMQAQQVRC